MWAQKHSFFGGRVPRAKMRHEEEDGDSGSWRLSEEKQGQTSPDSESDPPRRSVTLGLINSSWGRHDTMLDRAD